MTITSCGTSYKASTIVIYESIVINVSNLLVNTTLEAYFFFIEAL